MSTLDENEVCEEVTALLDRMEKFPEEFLDDYTLDHKWARLLRLVNDDEHNKDVFSSAELRLLKEKIKGLTRVRMKREILQNIFRANMEDDGFLRVPDDLTYQVSQGKSKRISVTAQTAQAVATQLQKNELMKRIEEEYAKQARTLVKKDGAY